MTDQDRSREQLIAELEELRTRLAEFEGGDVDLEPGEVYLAGGIGELRDVLNNVNAGIVAHAADTTIRVCNPMACEILGLTMDQMIGIAVPDPQWMFVREDGSEMPIEEYPAVVVLSTKKELRNLVVGVRRPALDDLAWVLVNGFPVLDEHGELQQAIISFIDITHRTEAIREKEQLQEQLRQAQKMEAIGRLAGGVAHDFNNILTGIIGYAELVLSDLDPEHLVYGNVEEIHKSGERAAELTNQLLSFARRQIIDPKVVQANEILANSEKMLHRLIGEDIELVFMPGKNLHCIRSDPGQIDQILVNLAVNARDAMPNGGKLTIETENIFLEGERCPMSGEIRSGDFVMLGVSDIGMGMDAETKKRIFEPFFSTKAKGEGTGLGLATVYGIVKQNGGFISVYSEVGVGTTFKIYFPAVLEEPDPITEPISLEMPVGDETILLVEDDRVVRELARKILATHGYTVLEACDGIEAELLCKRYSGPIHLLLTDVVMPRVNGLELYDRLLLRRPKLLSLFMSGYTENVIAHHGILDSGTNFLRKPFTIGTLARAVRDVIDGES